MAFDAGTAIAGLIGVGVGGYVQFALQHGRNRREERSALVRLDALLGDIEVWIGYAATEGYFEDSAWKPRVERLMRHTELPALATAFLKKPDRYGYVLRVAAAIERQSTQLQSPNLSPPTQTDIDVWAKQLRKKYDNRLLVKIAWESHTESIRRWAEILVGPVDQVREDIQDELTPRRVSFLNRIKLKQKRPTVTPSGIMLASKDDLRTLDSLDKKS